MMAIELAQALHRYSSGLVLHLEKDEEPESERGSEEKPVPTVDAMASSIFLTGSFRFHVKRFSGEREEWEEK